MSKLRTRPFPGHKFQPLEQCDWCARLAECLPIMDMCCRRLSLSECAEYREDSLLIAARGAYERAG